jgi:hypothetical protein
MVESASLSLYSLLDITYRDFDTLKNGMAFGVEEYVPEEKCDRMSVRGRWDHGSFLGFNHKITATR